MTKKKTSRKKGLKESKPKKVAREKRVTKKDEPVDSKKEPAVKSPLQEILENTDPGTMAAIAAAIV